jgi:hypothetical protein
LPYPSLQSLSTQQIDAAAAGDACLDLLTGFHVTDGSERLILLEGLAGGRAMQVGRVGVDRIA